MNDNETMETNVNETSEPQETQAQETMDPIDEPTTENGDLISEPAPETVETNYIYTESGEVLPLDVKVIEPVEMVRNYTEIQTNNGTIQIIHEITLGEIVTSVLMATILIFLILNKFVRR